MADRVTTVRARVRRNPWWWPWGGALAAWTTLQWLGIHKGDGFLLAVIMSLAFLTGRAEGRRRG